MSKTSKAERDALDAISEASTAVKRAEKEAARAELESSAADEALAAELTAKSAEEHDAEDAAGDGLSASTVAQLRARANAEGHSGYSRLTKAQLIDLLS